MSNTTTITDRRLLAALDYIDQKYIDDVFSIIKEPEADSPVPVRSWRTPLKHSKIYVALAASLLLLGMASPLVSFFTYVVSNFTAGAGSGTTEESTKVFENTDHIGEYLYGRYLEPIKNLEPLPVGLIEELNQNSKFGFTSLNVINVGLVLSDRYLGCINDYYVFFNTSAGSTGNVMAANQADSLHVAGYDFYYSNPFNIILYRKNSIKITLEDAYESGTITFDEVRKIYQRNNEYIRFFSPELNFKDKIPISSDEFESVRQAWVAKYGTNDYFANSYEETNGENMLLYFYGWIGENIIFHAGDPEYTGPNQWNEFDIEGNKFTTFPKFINIWVYNNGHIMRLSEAYEKGAVNSDDLSTISYMNQCICD